MAPIHREFEWDEEKAASNARKHRVTFDDASRVLLDPDGDRFQVDEDDPGHAEGEDRVITMASDPQDRRKIYIISWTDRSREDEQVTRIISARLADKKERKKYADRFQG